MAKFNLSDIEKYKEIHNYIESTIHDILMTKSRIEQGKEGYLGNIEKFYFESNKVHVEVVDESRCSCCQDDIYYYSFPVKYLFDDSWVEDYEEEIERKKEEERIKKQKKEEQKRKEQEERDRKEFERLKNKFEN